MGYVVLIATNRPPERIEVDKVTVNQLQAWVDGYFEIIALKIKDSPDVDMYVNEDGLMHRLPYNPYASVLAGQSIVGTVVLCGRKGSATIGLDESIAKVFAGEKG